MELIFWISLAAIFHSYVIFPFSLQIASLFNKKVRKRYLETDNNLPFVSVLMSVFNEEDVIKEKLESIVGTSYPKEKIEIIIGSDKSDDNTNRIISEYANKDPRIKLTEYHERQGKPNVINRLVEKAKGEILLLTDANVIFSQSTIFELIKYFIDKRVGLVDANMLNKGLNKDGISYQEKAYISREVLIKNREGNVWGAMMGPFGGCFAVQKELFSEVPSNFLVDDFYINMKVIDKGYHSINNIDAKVFEDISNDLKEEFRRKVRIATGNFQNLQAFSNLIFKPKGIGYCFFSHKVLRWLGPFFIILTLLSSFVLGLHERLYIYLFYIQVLIILLPFIDYLLRKIGIHIIILRFVTHFYSMNLALLVGFVKFLKGVKSNVWQPTKRNQ